MQKYRGKGCDSHELFAGLKIESDSSYENNLNKYDVIHVDMASMWLNSGKRPDNFIPFLNQMLFAELSEEYSTVDLSDCVNLSMALAQISYSLGIQFVIIIDEWDTIFREEKENVQLQDDYISMLRSLFKSEDAKHFVALAYITGILPIKKYGIESALNNFREYTMIDPVNYAEYYGFTSQEVKELCKRYDMNYDTVRYWYDGYSFEGEPHIYNPNSVVNAMLDHRYKSYWSNTETFSSLQGYISLNFEGLKDDIIRMFSGERCRVMVGSFANDLVSYKNKDDVLTALIHLGYLAYDFNMREAYIPNAEVQEAFEYAIKGTEWREIVDSVNA